jgi:hypothetical protein
MWGIKTMTNREWVIKEMQNMRTEDLCDLLQDCNLKEYGVVYDTSYGKCMCKWLDAEHKEKPKLSSTERVILENIPVGFCYIARNKDGYLAVYYGKPAKGSAEWNPRGFAYHSLYCFNHLFQFIKWEDAEAYNTEELLKGE